MTQSRRGLLGVRPWRLLESLFFAPGHSKSILCGRGSSWIAMTQRHWKSEINHFFQCSFVWIGRFPSNGNWWRYHDQRPLFLPSGFKQHNFLHSSYVIHVVIATAMVNSLSMFLLRNSKFSRCHFQRKSPAEMVFLTNLTEMFPKRLFLKTFVVESAKEA